MAAMIIAIITLDNDALVVWAKLPATSIFPSFVEI
jgi:hypothetical protein